ncbi:MAG TPA: efflux RND transporter periplasmic adaptor subunit [Isosphaeraceae bacterium]
MRMPWKFPIATLAVGTAVVLVALTGRASARIRDTWNRLTASAAPDAAPAPAPPAPRAPWDGVIEVDADQRAALDLKVVPVAPQSEPIRLPVNGRTAYDEDTLTRIRPRFNSLIARVHVRLGQAVTKGDPLVDLFSPELAGAKSEYEKQSAQWDHDRRQLARSESLYQKGAMSEKAYLDDVNDEKQSGLQAKLALDNLLVLGLTPQEIANVKNEDGTQKAKMTLRSPSDGIVINRDVAQGNLYDETNILLTIAPLDHFWVWGDVYPSDAAWVHLGQPWEIRYPTLGRPIRGAVESITSSVDENTKTIRIRTTIKNLNDRIKADMLVAGALEIPPTDGFTVIPRAAMVSTDGADYVFVSQSEGATKGPERFERRSVRVVQENHDRVIVAEGLEPGERVATQGSLILAQIYEDASQTGTAP